MLKSRFVVIMALFALLLAVLAPATVAQEETFGLSAEDFALLTGAIGQSSEFDSLGFDFSVAIAAEAEEGGTIALTGTGLIGESAAGGPVAQLNMSGTVDDASGSQPFSFDIILIDDTIYVNDGTGWQGQKLEDIAESFGSMSPIPLDSIASGDMSQDPAAMEGMMGAMNALGEINPADYVSMVRAADEDGSAHFTINLDAASFLSSEAFQQLLDAGVAMSGDESMAQQTQGMGQMLGMMLQDMTVALDYYIGADTNLVQRFMFNFGLGINPAMMGGGADAQPVNVSLVIDASNIQYNPDVSGIVAPEGATMTEGAAG